VKETTILMREAMSIAVTVLRERLRWSQIRLAAEMNKLGEHKAGEMMRRGRISRWERRLAAPSPTHRMTLGKISVKHGSEDLRAIFRALPVLAWTLARALPGSEQQHGGNGSEDV
jgi:transcriptional regulator with XRE-family HTH domain